MFHVSLTNAWGGDELSPSAILFEKKLDVSWEHRWLELLESALFRRFVRAEAYELGAVAKAVVRHVVVAHLDYEFRFQRLPFARSLGAPPAWATRGLAR